MAITSRLTSAGDFLVTNQFDEYSLQNNSYAVQFNGTSQYLSLASNAAFAFGTGDFTIEGWFYFNTAPGAGTADYDIFDNSAAGQFGFALANTGIIPFTSFGAAIGTFNYTWSTNIWYHIAVVRSGTTLSCYVNGSLVNTATGVSNNFTCTGTVIIGKNAASANQYINGYISNFRVVKGTAIYTANFIPPTTPLTAIANTSLLTCQNSTIVDNSTNAFTITNNGTATTSNVPSTFYSGSFNGSNQYLSIPSSAALDIWTTSSSATLEFWYYSTSATQTGHLFIMGPSGTNRVYLISQGSSLTLGTAISGTFTTRITSGVSVVQNTWYHVAISRIGATYTLYVNGNSQGSSSLALYNNGGNGVPLYIGVQAYSPLAADWFNGYISNFRVVNGTAVYTANFTPPTRQLTAVAGTSLLTLQSPTIIDKSNTPLTITNNGTAIVKNPISWNTVKREFSDGTFQTFNDIDEYTLQNSVYATQFNGSSQYLTVPSNTALDFGTGDFTVEAWVYTGAPPGGGVTFDKAVFGGFFTNPPSFLCFLTNGGNAPALWDGTAQRTSSISVPTNTWTHVAWVRSSSTLSIYVNGAVGFTVGSYTINFTFTTARYIGRSDTTNDRYFSGYISNLRVVKGTAVYTAAFTPSTSPLTAITNTQLLTCQNPTIIDNSTNTLTITNNGSVPTTYVPSKFYTALFNGSNQYLTAPANAGFSFGTGDFTVECWIRTPAFTNTYGRIIIDARPIATNGSYWVFGLDNNGIPVFYPLVTGTFIGGSTSVATNSWVHLAATRQSGTLRLFVNGVSAATPITGNVDNISSSGSGFRIGFNSFGTVGGFAAETLWNGNISNLRVVKGTALYTANFTPPTTQLTAVSGTTLLTFQSPTIIDNSGNALSLTNNGTVTTQSPASFIQTKSRLFSNGSLQVANSFDEYTIKI